MSLPTAQQVVLAQGSAPVATADDTTATISHQALDLTENDDTVANKTEVISVLRSELSFVVDQFDMMFLTRFICTELQQQGSLGKLPGEIRNRIFEKALTNQVGLMIIGLPSGSHKQNIAVSLLSTCQQFSHEGRDLLYRRNTFIIGTKDSKLVPIAKLDEFTCIPPVIPPLLELGISVQDTCIKFMTFHIGHEFSIDEGCWNTEYFIHSLDSVRNIIQVHELTLIFPGQAFDLDLSPAMLARALTKLEVANRVTIDATIEMWCDEYLPHLAVELGMDDKPSYTTDSLKHQDYCSLPKTMYRTDADESIRGVATFSRKIATKSPKDHGSIDTTVAGDSVTGASDSAAAQ